MAKHIHTCVFISAAVYTHSEVFSQVFMRLHPASLMQWNRFDVQRAETKSTIHQLILQNGFVDVLIAISKPPINPLKVEQLFLSKAISVNNNTMVLSNNLSFFVVILQSCKERYSSSRTRFILIFLFGTISVEHLENKRSEKYQEKERKYLRYIYTMILINDYYFVEYLFVTLSQYYVKLCFSDYVARKKQLEFPFEQFRENVTSEGIRKFCYTRRNWKHSLRLGQNHWLHVPRRGFISCQSLYTEMLQLRVTNGNKESLVTQVTYEMAARISSCQNVLNFRKL